MAKINSVEEARQTHRHEAATRALDYLKSEAPLTLDAILFYVNEAKWEVGKIMNEFSYLGPTEERVKHKIKLIVEAFVAERDK